MCGRYSASFVPKDEFPPDQYALDVAGGPQNFSSVLPLSAVVINWLMVVKILFGENIFI